MKTNEEHVKLAKKVFTATGRFDTIDIKLIVLRTLSMAHGKGPLTKDELDIEIVRLWGNKRDTAGAVLDVLGIHLTTLLEEKLVEHRMFNGVEVYVYTPYFEDLVFWQKVKAGLIPRPQK